VARRVQAVIPGEDHQISGLRQRFGRVLVGGPAVERLAQRGQALGALQRRSVGQAPGERCRRQAVERLHCPAEVQADHGVGVMLQLGEAHVGHNQRGPAIVGLLGLQIPDRGLFLQVGGDDQHGVAFAQLDQPRSAGQPDFRHRAGIAQVGRPDAQPAAAGQGSQLAQGEQILVGHHRPGDEAHAVPGVLEHLARRLDRVLPVRFNQLAALADQRCAQAVGTHREVVAEAGLVGDPDLVDGLVLARQDALDHLDAAGVAIQPRAGDDVLPDRAMGGDAGHIL